MHIPLPTTGDLESLEAFRKAIVSLNEKAERYFVSIFGESAEGDEFKKRQFLAIPEQLDDTANEEALHNSDIVLFVRMLHPHSMEAMCSFSWKVNGECVKNVFLCETTLIGGSSGQMSDWQSGAIDFLITVSACLRGIPTAFMALDRLSKLVESSLEEARRCA